MGEVVDLNSYRDAKNAGDWDRMVLVCAPPMMIVRYYDGGVFKNETHWLSERMLRELLED